MGWIFAGVALLFAATVLYLESGSFAERARREAERRLGAALEREVSIGDLEIDLVPLTVVVEDVSIAGAAGGDAGAAGGDVGASGEGGEAAAGPLFSLARGLVEARPGGFLGRRLELDHVRLVEPRLAIGFDEEGRADLPRLGGGARRGTGEPMTIRFGSVEIERGELVLDDDRTPLDLAVRDLEAIFAGVADGIELRGRARTADLGVTLPPGKSYDAAVELHGVLRAHRFDVVRAELAGEDLDVRADGYWRWHGDREVSLDLEADGDLAALGRLGYLDGLAGPFRFRGELIRKPGILLVDGEVDSPRAVVFERVLTDLQTRLHVDTNVLTVDILRARHGNGKVSGGVELGLAVDPGRVDVQLQLERVALSRLTGDLGLPIEGLSGGVSGAFHYQFDGAAPAAGNGWADLVVADENTPSAADLPVTGTIPLAIGDGVLRSSALRLTAPSFRLEGTGDYDLGSARGAWRFGIDTDDVAEVVRLLPGGAAGDAGAAVDVERGGDRRETGGSAAAWRPTAGRGRATAELTLGPAGTAVRVLLDLAAVEAPGLDADGLTGVVALDGAGVRELRLEATRPEAALLVSGVIPFENVASGVAPLSFELAVDAAGWPLEESRAWLPFEMPVSGPYTGLVELSAAAPVDGLLGRLAGRVSPVVWGDTTAEALVVAAVFGPDALALERADLVVADGTLTASGSVEFKELSLDLAVESTPLTAGALLDLPADAAPDLARLGGSLSGRVRGRLEEPDIEARLVWSDAPQEAIDLVWRSGRLSARGAVPGIVRLEGGGDLSPERVDLAFDLTDGRVAGLARLAAPDLGLAGELAGRLLVTGRYDQEVDLATTLVLDRLTARVPEEEGDAALPRLANLEPVVLELDDAGLRLRSLYLADEAATSEIFVGGRVGPEGELDLQLQTAIAADWLGVAVDRLWPGARWSNGTFDAIATVRGTLGEPRVNGVGEVRGARLVAEGLPAAVEDLSGTVLFYRDQVVVDSVEARLAGGTVRAGGVVPLGSEEPSFRFQAVGERLSYRSSEGWSARGDGDLVLASTPDGLQLSGGVALAEVLYVKDVKLGLEQLLEGLFSSERLEVVPAEGWRAATHLNLRIEGDRVLRVRNNLADLRGSVDLVLRGTLSRPVVFGTVEVEPGGRLEYGGADYRVERGQLAFTNPYRIEPAIDLSARTELREYDITLNLAGTLDRLELDFASNPPLADLDVLGLLSGTPGAAVREGTRSDQSVSAQSFLYGQATSLIAQRFNRLFGLDKFRIDPLTSSTGDLSSARVTIGKRLTRDLSVTYSYDPASTEEQVLELDWNVTRALSLLLTQNGDGTYAVDALWEKAF